MASCQVKEETDYMSNCMSHIQPGYNIYEIIYPEKKMDKDERQAFKNKIITGHPETLFADKNGKGQITNLLFLTQQGDKWHNTLCGHYKVHTKDTKKVARVLEVGDEDHAKCLKIHIYNNGKVMLQGTEERLRNFEPVFIKLKDKISCDNDNSLLSDNRGKITSYFHKIDDLKEEGASKEKEEKVLMEDKLTGVQCQEDCAAKQEEEKNNVKNENADKITEAT